jgi:predicted glycosyltransferase
MNPSLLFYCQHSVGIGHLTRSFALARALAAPFRVVFLNGGPLPPGTAVPQGIDIIHLPPLGMDDGHTLVSRDATVDVGAARSQRRALILETVAACRPDVLLVELFPFGRKKFAFEILPLIRAARAATQGRTRLVCSLRDILVSDRKDQQRHDDRARWLANRYFDAIVVHSDPAFARLEETFRPSRPLTVPVFYTGFVVPQRPPQGAVARRREILVSAGGGIVGYPLFAVALQAQEILWRRHRLPMRIVAGPFLPPADFEALRQAAAGREGVEIVAHVPDLAAEMRQATASVSQCGYNTALDIVVSGVPALVVPYAAKGENEQTQRAQRLAALQAIRYLPTAELDPARLAAEIEELLTFAPMSASIGLDGARTCADILLGLCAGQAAAPAAAERCAGAMP